VGVPRRIADGIEQQVLADLGPGAFGVVGNEDGVRDAGRRNDAAGGRLPAFVPVGVFECEVM